MSERGKQWFQARLRWAVMEEGRGLDHWLEAEHIFQSDSREAAFAEALRIGHSQEYVVVPDRGRATTFEHRLAEVVYLEERLVRKNRGLIRVRVTCQVSDTGRVRGSGRCGSRRIFSW